MNDGAGRRRSHRGTSWAPKESWAADYSRTELVDREKADDPTLYTVGVDASRLPADRIVGVLLAAGDAT